jgi:hypothetical protein
VSITTIKTPAHFPTIDTVDITREVIGLIWAKHPQLDGVPIRIIGVRGLGYYAPSNTHWPAPTTSRKIRKANWTVLVKYERS